MMCRSHHQSLQCRLKGGSRQVLLSTHLSTSSSDPRPTVMILEPQKRLTGSLKRKQPLESPSTRQQAEHPRLFKKPTREMARSFNTTSATGASTVDTSFNPMRSSQQTQPDTPNTSFTSESDYQKLEHHYDTKTKAHPASYGSLTGEGLLSLSEKLEKQASSSQGQVELRHRPSQDSTQGSSSAFGSVDDEELYNLSFQLESQEQFGPRLASDSLLCDEPSYSAVYPPTHIERSVSPERPNTTKSAATKSFLPTTAPLPKLSPPKLDSINRHSTRR